MVVGAMCCPMFARNRTSLRSKGPVQYTGHSFVSVSRSACDDRLTLFGRSRSCLLSASHRRTRLSYIDHVLFRSYRLLQGGDHLARTTNCLKVVLLVDPSTLRCSGV